MCGSIRDAIANAIQERWPDVKITNRVDRHYDGAVRTPKIDPQHLIPGRINVEYPVYDSPALRDITIHVASIDVCDGRIIATFYGGRTYTNDLHHPESITDLEELLASHLEHVKNLACRCSKQ
jgi:hypothetical protein